MVKIAVFETASNLAPMLVVPWLALTASPVLLTIATAGLEEVHCATEDTSCCVSSEKVPMAANCWVNPSWSAGFVGTIEMDWTVAFVTVRVTGVAVRPWNEALMLTVPALTPVATPLFVVATE